MNFRRFATLLLFVILVIVFSKTSVLAAAEGSAKGTVAATKGAVSTKSAGVKSKASTEKKTSDKIKKYTNSELRLMSAIINCEAGGESYQGKLAVGIVVMNRISSKQFPNTLRGVIYQKNQFSPVRNGALRKRLAQYDAGKIKGKQWQSCIRAAKKVLEGQTYITYRGSKKNLKGYHFFSVHLPGSRFRLGGHRFK